MTQCISHANHPKQSKASHTTCATLSRDYTHNPSFVRWGYLYTISIVCLHCSLRVRCHWTSKSIDFILSIEVKAYPTLSVSTVNCVGIVLDPRCTRSIFTGRVVKCTHKSGPNLMVINARCVCMCIIESDPQKSWKTRTWTYTRLHTHSQQIGNLW